jgi:hypothetical protein
VGAHRARFVRVGSFPTNAAAGLAALTGYGGEVFLATANYYGTHSTIHAFDPTTLRVRLVQTVWSSAAHGCEAIVLGDPLQLVFAQYESDSSPILQLSGGPAGDPVSLPDLECADARSECAQWAREGECDRNAPFMRRACGKSCGCEHESESGPFKLAQRVSTSGACAAHHFAVDDAGGARHHFLAVANGGDRLRGVEVLEWARGEWRVFRALEYEGAAELSHIAEPSGTVILAVATWYASGRFDARSHLYRFDPVRAGAAAFELLASFPTAGAHDVHLAAMPREAGAAAVLFVANARHDDSPTPASSVYRLGADWRPELAGAIGGVGAHDIEVIDLLEELGINLVIVSEQGNGVACTAATRAYEWDPLSMRLARSHALVPDGCVTFARHFRAAGRVFVALALERRGSDPRDMDSYRTDSLVFELLIG